MDEWFSRKLQAAILEAKNSAWQNRKKKRIQSKSVVFLVLIPEKGKFLELVAIYLSSLSKLSP